MSISRGPVAVVVDDLSHGRTHREYGRRAGAAVGRLSGVKEKAASSSASVDERVDHHDGGEGECRRGEGGFDSQSPSRSFCKTAVVNGKGKGRRLGIALLP